MIKHILFIDDQLDLWEQILRDELRRYNFEVEGEENPSKALELIESYKPDVVLLDIQFPGGNLGKPILEKIKSKYPRLPVMMLTSTMDKSEYRPEDYALADYRFAKIALTGGDFSDLAYQLSQIIEKHKSNSDFFARYDFIVGKTAAMQTVTETIEKIADQDITVLITGESGTGKELVAQAIHKLSKRKEQPFLVVVCAAIPKELLEGELFGYEKGAFTGATSTKKGKFEIAESGTIFLDEIGELSPDTQVKLLRFLQEKTFERVGGNQVITSKAHIIAATNKDLTKLIQEERFREDLFFRLNVVSVHLPPLRERKEDIFLFFKYFIEKANQASGKKILPIMRDDIKEIMNAHVWPGNIREMENMIFSAVALAEENILQISNFPNLTGTKDNGILFDYNIAALVDQIFYGQLTWLDLRGKFGTRGNIRREILLKIKERWEKEHKRYPTQKEMAALLKTTYGNMRRILSDNKINLSEKQG